MSRKKELKNAISDVEQEMEAIEKKLFRSQTVLLLAMLNGTEPDKTEVEYFKLYASLIEQGRKRLKEFNAELNGLDGDNND